MRHLLPPLLLGLLCFICSCKSDKGFTYAIKDFRKDLQPELFKIVKQGYISYHGLPKSVTDEELRNLSRSEHSQLRVVALREMFDRKSFNQFDILMDHLDDTAWVYVERGNLGFTTCMYPMNYLIKQNRTPGSRNIKLSSRS